MPPPSAAGDGEVGTSTSPPAPPGEAAPAQRPPLPPSGGAFGCSRGSCAPPRVAHASGVDCGSSAFSDTR
eukprot:7803020-Alexandrium_andersonii.AAC.1